MKRTTKKSIAALLLVTLVSVAMLTGCSGSKATATQAQTTEAVETITDGDVAEATTVAETAEETTAATVSDGSGKPAEIANAMKGEDSSKENLVPFGTWASVGAYSTVDHLYHNVYAKITNVSMDPDYVDLMVSNHNACSGLQIDLSSVELPADIKWGIMEYEMYIPDDFPAGEYGISTFSLSFKATNIEDGGFPSADGTAVYLALGTSKKDLTVEDCDWYNPGETHTLALLFAMVDGYENYCFSLDTYKDGLESSTETMYSAYFAKN